TSDRNVIVTKHAPWLAKTSGNRTFPWRVMIITREDKDLVQSEMIWKLSRPLELKNVSWIKPGKVAWDWWNALNVYGVDFKSGVNTDTYKYFIDFAHKYGLEYIILDEGWYELDDVLKIRENVDLPEILRYAKSKDVGVILWVTWKALDDQLDKALEQFEQWGVKGIKVDFMQRDDQWMVDYYRRVARKAAEHHLLVDYHGAYKPTGLRRAYPNVITREGVAGLEQDKWGEKANPEHDVTLPFIRIVAGPMDYTPGAMINATKKNFRPVWGKPMSQGTRCHQLAMYVVYESPLQMLADSPSNYMKEKDAMDFLTPVPTVWDTTVVLGAKVSDYILMARKSGNKWYLGAMTDWDARDLQVDFGFLPDGNYTLEIWQDGINADRYASDYKRITKAVNKDTKLDIHLAPGGGWVGVVIRE
ncbi:MAG: glycoside hydrolase family 97 protein, partial [Chlorobi bacterium]|nr:glycoside hydrolase family 97 protein [Chlorobiota bacterium]